jgi:hypothetical protein
VLDLGTEPRPRAAAIPELEGEVPAERSLARGSAGGSPSTLAPERSPGMGGLTSVRLSRPTGGRGGVAKDHWEGSNPPMEAPNPEEQAKARRALLVLYAVMAIGVALPLVLYLVLR